MWQWPGEMWSSLLCGKRAKASKQKINVNIASWNKGCEWNKQWLFLGMTDVPSVNWIINNSSVEFYLSGNLKAKRELITWKWEKTPSCSESGWLMGVAHAEPIVLPDFSTTQELEGMSSCIQAHDLLLSFCLDLPEIYSGPIERQYFSSSHLALWSDLRSDSFMETGWNGLWHIPFGTRAVSLKQLFFLSLNFLFPLKLSHSLSFWTCQNASL